MPDLRADRALGRARVVDMSAFTRLVAQGVGAPRIAKTLGVPRSSAQHLMAGKHWQQDPEKVRKFNELRGSRIDPETGVPTADDLVNWGGLTGGVHRHSSQVAKDLSRVMSAAGHGGSARDVAERLTAIEGGSIDVPKRLDTATFLALNEEKLYLAYKLMTPDLIASAGPRDLTAMISMLVEKRQLLRGEPTAITRHDQRVGLDVTLKRLFEEARRRGVVLDTALPATEFVEVQG